MGQELTIHIPRPLTREEQIAHILRELSAGRALNSILRDDDDMPHWRDFWNWYSDDPELDAKVARARQVGIEALLETALEIANTPVEAVEIEEGIGPKGPYKKRSIKEALGHRRLQIDTIIKRAQMMKPKTYGPKLDLTTDGEKLSSIADAIAAGNKRLEADSDSTT